MDGDRSIILVHAPSHTTLLSIFSQDKLSPIPVDIEHRTSSIITTHPLTHSLTPSSSAPTSLLVYESTKRTMPAVDENTNDKFADTITAKNKARAQDMLAYTQRQVDRVVSPSTRQKAVDSTTAFVSKRPLLAVCSRPLDSKPCCVTAIPPLPRLLPPSALPTDTGLFIAAQLLVSLFPLLIFTTFVLSTVALVLVCAVAFALFWTGVALLFLVPTLFFTSGLAVLVWLWAVGTYLVARAVYARLPENMRGSGRRSSSPATNPPIPPRLRRRR
ncbi:hypothetical protein NUW58_g10898 [Xylaria curta]|uniref:Uncharacterized protein n=1 Tax=Xylaria curta TaxID=42375 RepID=A0ACC1MG93_9PEZI|nr:hypothetical protein NUW58_g10898 [Xylaria curta]